MAVLTVVLLQGFTHQVKTKPLNGYVEEKESVELNFHNCYDGSYQDYLTYQAQRNTGFREPVIRLYNQFTYSVFNKTHCHFIITGKDGWLYYTEAFNDYYGLEPIHFFRTYDRARNWARQNVRMMNKLRCVLKDYGVEFLCFMAPNKAEVYPEHLPYHQPAPPNAINTAAYYDSLMNEIDFPHVEMTQWFKAIKDTASFLLFPKRDMHWRYSAVYGYDSLFSYMNSLNNFGIPDIEVKRLHVLDTSYLEVDEQTLNLLFPIPDDSPKYWPEITIDCSRGNHKPKVLFIGDSFINDLPNYLPWKSFIDEIEVWFYNKTVISNFNEKHPVSEINRLRSLLKADFVVWYSSGYQWSQSSYDFVEDALLQLCVTDSLFEAQIPWVMDSLRHDSAFACHNMTWQHLDSYEDSLRKYAIKALKNNPELIPGLKGESMPTIRNTQAIKMAQQANEIANDRVWLKALEMKAYESHQPLDQLIDTEAENVVCGHPLLKDGIPVDTITVRRFEMNKIIDRWRNDPNSIEYLQQKAKERGKTFEQMLEADALWVVNQKQNNGTLF